MDDTPPLMGREGWEERSERERQELRDQARMMGDRMIRQDGEIAGHTEHFVRLNGSVQHMEGTVAEQGRLLAVMTTTLERIEKSLDTRRGTATQWQLVLAGAVVTCLVALMGFIGTAILTVIVLAANGAL